MRRFIFGDYEVRVDLTLFKQTTSECKGLSWCITEMLKESYNKYIQHYTTQILLKGHLTLIPQLGFLVL